MIFLKAKSNKITSTAQNRIAPLFLFQKITTTISSKKTHNTEYSESYNQQCRGIRGFWNIRIARPVGSKLNPPEGSENNTNNTQNQIDDTEKSPHTPTLSQGKEGNQPNTNRTIKRRVRGALPLLTKLFPLPLIKGKGDKGG